MAAFAILAPSSFALTSSFFLLSPFLIFFELAASSAHCYGILEAPQFSIFSFDPGFGESEKESSSWPMLAKGLLLDGTAYLDDPFPLLGAADFAVPCRNCLPGGFFCP